MTASATTTANEAREITYVPNRNVGSGEKPNLGNSRKVMLVKFADQQSGKLRSALAFTGKFENKPVLK